MAPIVSIRNLKNYREFGWCWEEKAEYEAEYRSYRTNASGEGLFEDNPENLPCTDLQILGTGQFSARTTDKRVAYRKIRANALRLLFAARY